MKRLILLLALLCSFTASANDFVLTWDSQAGILIKPNGQVLQSDEIFAYKVMVNYSFVPGWLDFTLRLPTVEQETNGYMVNGTYAVPLCFRVDTTLKDATTIIGETETCIVMPPHPPNVCF